MLCHTFLVSSFGDLGNREPSEEPKLDDFRLARWMAENLPRESVVIEAAGETYAPDGRIAAWSGLPSVVGWVQHESVWRGDRVETYIVQALNAIDLVYLDGDLETAQLLNADYVVFGQLERERYSDASGELLERNFELLHQKGDSRLYSVTPNEE